jgi:hypothetical protein
VTPPARSRSPSTPTAAATAPSPAAMCTGGQSTRP